MATKTPAKVEKKSSSRHIAITLLIIANLGFSVAALLISLGNSPVKLEQMKAGGAENFQLMEQIFESDTYQTQQKESLQQMLNAYQGQAVDTTEEVAVEENTESPADLDAMKKQFKEMQKDAVIVGDKNARFTIYEYSELFCPFCQRQHNQGVLDAVMEEFNGEVNTAFRHFIVHNGAERYAQAAECIADIAGDEGHIDFIDMAFQLDSAINDDSLSTILDEMGLDKDEIMKCIDEGKYADLVNDQSTEGRAFGVTGTPGNIIVDNDTGRFVLVAGAYPVEKFVEEINKLLAE